MVDDRVLEAQRWVNATYAGVAGYVAVPETGKTGWSTMYSLTRALQYELGISPLSDAFGPATLAALESRGGISSTSPANMIRIVQHGCFCKGYNPGVVTGTYTPNTQNAVGLMERDAGVGPSAGAAVRPKTMKALLSMDAYVVVLGGTETVRGIQQWLNGKYLSHSGFFIGPCDGNFSRDVQKSLMLGIQYELGIPDSQATGTFGPTTQSGLRNQTLTVGSSGVFVQLFTAALVFNGYGSFTASYSSAIAGFVTTFQKFSALPQNGTADFGTWAQLLVSTGDPARPGTAFDCVTRVTPARATSLRNAGYRVAGRYLDEVPGGIKKKIEAGELAEIFAGGLRVFPISQYNGGVVGYFTYNQGYTDAGKAHTAALGYGFDRGTVIYFAVDYDATQAEIDSNIVPYFQGVVGGLRARGKRYVHGVYGPRNVCIQVSRSTSAAWSFVSGMSTGFSGNLGFPLPENWAFNQIQTLAVSSSDGGITIDKDVQRPGGDQGVAAVNTAATSADGFLNYLVTLLGLAREYGAGDPSLLVLGYLYHRNYNDSIWNTLNPKSSDGFTALVESRNVAWMATFIDPSSGVEIDIPHWAASATGSYTYFPRPTPPAIDKGDVTGWAGDLFTFYGEWRRDSASYSSGYSYCLAKLAILSAEGTFRLGDLIEDADAHIISANRRTNGQDIAAATRAHLLGTGAPARFNTFYTSRFGGTRASASATARQALTTGDPEISSIRTLLIQSLGGFPTVLPSDLPGGKLDEFCNGFADVLIQRAQGGPR